jgi:hypothetical protein
MVTPTATPFKRHLTNHIHTVALYFENVSLGYMRRDQSLIHNAAKVIKMEQRSCIPSSAQVHIYGS